MNDAFPPSKLCQGLLQHLHFSAEGAWFIHSRVDKVTTHEACRADLLFFISIFRIVRFHSVIIRGLSRDLIEIHMIN